ncbi:hypothetical protein ACKS0A_06581 [Histoplasma ohiense]
MKGMMRWVYQFLDSSQGAVRRITNCKIDFTVSFTTLVKYTKSQTSQVTNRLFENGSRLGVIRIDILVILQSQSMRRLGKRCQRRENERHDPRTKFERLWW